MGSTLSGGQKQRIVLAPRALPASRLLFLDEATSHLDEATEAAIVAALRDLQMTRVIIAHRPAAIAHADLVIPLASINRPVTPIHEMGVRAKRPSGINRIFLALGFFRIHRFVFISYFW
jgi:ABC-type transport system involved in cytochrome bd biosynthesis fused ATPase/permease subunit